MSAFIFVDRRLVADVAGDGDRAHAERLDLLDDLAEVLGLAIFRRRAPVEIVDRDIGAEAGELERPSRGRGRGPSR